MRRKNGDMSVRMRLEYDCKQESYRYLGLSGHSEPMAGGEVLGMEGEDNKWRAIAPDTIANTILNLVCSK